MSVTSIQLAGSLTDPQVAFARLFVQKTYSIHKTRRFITMCDLSGLMTVTNPDDAVCCAATLLTYRTTQRLKFIAISTKRIL
jgi:hypothetical protein